MISRIMSAALMGIDAYLLEVEASLERGLMAFALVGLPDSAVKEGRERVMAAVKNRGLNLLKKGNSQAEQYLAEDIRNYSELAGISIG